MWKYNNPEELYHYGVIGMRWGRRNARKEAKVLKRRTKATNKAVRLLNKNPNSARANNAAIKATKINASRYGKTRGQIVTSGILKTIRNSAIGSVGMATAIAAGRKQTAKNIAMLTSGANTVTAVKTGYQVVNNYKPRKS